MFYEIKKIKSIMLKEVEIRVFRKKKGRNGRKKKMGRNYVLLKSRWAIGWFPNEGSWIF